VRLRRVAEAAGHRDLLARREVARADDRAVVDRVADHDVEARLRGGRADARGPAHVEVALRDLGAPQDVLLGGMRWIASRLGWSFHEKWVCASTMPGIRNAPAASTVVAPCTGRLRAP
jgi:hypothetical protein